MSGPPFVCPKARFGGSGTWHLALSLWVSLPPDCRHGVCFWSSKAGSPCHSQHLSSFCLPATLSPPLHFPFLSICLLFLLSSVEFPAWGILSMGIWCRRSLASHSEDSLLLHWERSPDPKAGRAAQPVDFWGHCLHSLWPLSYTHCFFTKPYFVSELLRCKRAKVLLYLFKELLLTAHNSQTCSLDCFLFHLSWDWACWIRV